MTPNRHELITTDMIQAKHLGRVVQVQVAAISHFKAEHKYVVAYHEGGELLLVTTLKHLLTLFGGHFIRIHHNTIAAKDRLERFRKYCQRTLVPATVHVRGVDQPLNVSRGQTPTVLAALGLPATRTRRSTARLTNKNEAAV